MIQTNQRVPVSQITVRIKSDDTTIKERFLIYDKYTVHYDDPVLKTCIDITKKKYAGTLVDPDIVVTSKLTWEEDVEQEAI